MFAGWPPDRVLLGRRWRADIWVMRIDGRGKRRVTRNGLLNEYPTWSPDSSQLAFNSHRDGQFEI
jgi:Tol biopolymer transport system component